jgi:hypothetical protein
VDGSGALVAPSSPLRKSPDGGCTAGKAVSKKAGLRIEAPALSGSGSVAYFDAFTM